MKITAKEPDCRETGSRSLEPSAQCFLGKEPLVLEISVSLSHHTMDNTEIIHLTTETYPRYVGLKISFSTFLVCVTGRFGTSCSLPCTTPMATAWTGLPLPLGEGKFYLYDPPYNKPNVSYMYLKGLGPTLVLFSHHLFFPSSLSD